MVYRDFFIYTFMKESLFKLPTNNLLDPRFNNEWKDVSTSMKPVRGLFNYGLAITDKGKLVIYGGMTEVSVPNPRLRDFLIYNDLWILDLMSSSLVFKLCEWNYKGGGYSKMVSLEGELISVLNPLASEKVILLDINDMKSYPIIMINDYILDTRVGFGIGALDGRNFIIGGGFNINFPGGELSESAKEYYLCVMTFSNSNLKFGFSTVASPVGFSLGIIGMFLLLVCLTLFLWKKHKLKNNKNKKIIAKDTPMNNIISPYSTEIDPGYRVDENNDNNCVVVRSVCMTENYSPHEMRAGKLIIERDSVGSNSFPPTYKTIEGVLPLTEAASIGVEFTILDLCGKKNYDSWFEGIILEAKLISKNSGVQECMVIMPEKEMESGKFLGAICINEILSECKYISKVLCYARTPSAIVLKTYAFGCLDSFITSKKYEMFYSFDIIVKLAQKITMALESIHSKNYIYNNMSSMNVMLDGDIAEFIFPVLIDFRSAVSSSKNKVEKGFENLETNTETLSYFSPEVLTCFKYKYDRVCSLKTDIYSVGIVLMELVTRKRYYDSFNINKVLSGKGPEFGVDDIIRNFKDIKIERAIVIMAAIMDCIDVSQDKRPSSKSLCSFMAGKS
jgi:serine/threonine protein kinase